MDYMSRILLLNLLFYVLFLVSRHYQALDCPHSMTTNLIERYRKMLLPDPLYIKCKVVLSVVFSYYRPHTNRTPGDNFKYMCLDRVNYTYYCRENYTF